MALRLHDDWEWIVSRAWSTRFIAVAFLLSGAEVALPLLADKAPIDPVLFAGVIGVVTGAAWLARFVAQDHAIPEEAQNPAKDDHYLDTVSGTALWLATLPDYATETPTTATAPVAVGSTVPFDPKMLPAGSVSLTEASSG
jgi:hypothetical protein